MRRQGPLTTAEALARLAALCARSEHCRYDVCEKMRQWGLSAEQQKEVVAVLEEERYVDDERYARLWVQEKVHCNRWGRQKIYMSLRQKHIADDNIRAALATISDDDYIAVLAPLLREKLRTLPASDTYQQRAALIRYALSRGYTMDIILPSLPSL